MNTVNVSVKWRLLSRPETERDYQVLRGITLAEFLPAVLADMQADEVIAVFNGKPLTLNDTLDADGEMELIPMLCGG